MWGPFGGRWGVLGPVQWLHVGLVLGARPLGCVGACAVGACGARFGGRWGVLGPVQWVHVGPVLGAVAGRWGLPKYYIFA